MIPVNRNPPPAELRKFGLTILLGLGVIGGLLWWLGGRGQTAGDGWSGRQVAAVVLWGAGPCVCLLCLVAPTVGRRVYVGWMSVAVVMGMVMTPVLFTVLFLVLLPVFSLIRLKDPLRLKRRNCSTFWEDSVPHEASIERMKRPF